MKKEDIEPWDWNRILFGEAPMEFLVEVFLRTAIMYVVLLVIVRLMGKRMGGQLTVSELAVMVTLGAIVSPAMQIPQLGVLMGIMILICALIFQRGLNLAEFSSRKFERLSQGTTGTLVKNGVIQLKEMSRSKISRQQLFSAIRGKSIYNLGDVGRVYFEACGVFSIYRKDETSPGLQIFPPSDQGINGYLQEIVEGAHACTVCGNVKFNETESQSCNNCEANDWVVATVTLTSQTEN
ncbi:DUF421 domain-containing protein [Dyadobacter sp. CY345]|uniref:DUF421 domain-containing protein n=1 Tax=Dyadobacter sp. CY345 TaxID=2909335 RepID=UPI001F309AFB|nr:YetF domain-containing protein [Dyadobacter sp. CY345]MCF2446696.1 DUF421 domain-containing protein [Dyadobacter sp. CY345]